MPRDRDLIELAWAAGFYEGEGSISASGHTLILTISQVNREPLDRFRACFGGIGTLRWEDARGVHLFRVYGWDSKRVASALWPHLSRRRQDQVLRALVKWSLRRVRDPKRCQRGHVYALTGERWPCPPLPTAFEARLGVREYVLEAQT